MPLDMAREFINVCARSWRRRKESGIWQSAPVLYTAIPDQST